MQKEGKTPLTRTITNFVSIAPVTLEVTEQVNLDDDSILHLILWEKNRCQDIGPAMIFQILGVRVLFLVAIHKCHLGKMIFPRIVIEPDMLFQRKNNTFLRNTTNKHCVGHVILTKFKKVGYSGFDDTDVGVIKSAVQSSSKCHVTVIG